MAPTRRNSSSNRLLKQLLEELENKIETTESGATTTKGKALIQQMIAGALEGDQKMLTNVLRLIDKLDLKEEEDKLSEEKHTGADWEMLFAFYGKYEILIKAEIERLKKIDPNYWSFAHFKPTLETAPWYEELYKK